MNFDYSYRAFLITSLLFAILFLGMYSIKLSRYTVEAENQLDFEYALEDIITEEELASDESEIKIQTHRAYNEAEKYISELENDRKEPSATTESKLQAMNEAINNAIGNTNEAKIKNAREAIKEAKDKLRTTNEVKFKNSKSSNKKTTISYSLVNRNAIAIPNPVYTCHSFGKVVISIEVNTIGKVTKTAYNEAASTTSNICLIEAALEYASKARFTTDRYKPTQIGTITYNYPGQQ